MTSPFVYFCILLCVTLMSQSRYMYFLGRSDGQTFRSLLSFRSSSLNVCNGWGENPRVLEDVRGINIAAKIARSDYLPSEYAKVF